MSPRSLEVRDLTIRRGEFTLRVDEWSAEPGECVAIVGANGAGKSTFLGALSGQLDAQRIDGHVMVLGRDVREWDYRLGDTLGLLPHAPIGLGYMRVSEYLALCASSHAAWDSGVAGALIDELGVNPRTRLDELSEGSRRKFGLACLEAAGPPVLLLDEPTASVDIAARRTILRAVTESRVRAPHRTLVLASHETADVLSLADRVDLLVGGRFVQSRVMPSRTDAAARAAALEEILGALDRPERLHA